MSTRISGQVQEGSSVGFRVTIYDSNSDAVIPSSLDWYLYDSLGAGVASGSPSSLSSQSLIVLGSSLTMVASGENRPEIKRVLRAEATYSDSELGTAIHKEAFTFTLVNNPGI